MKKDKSVCALSVLFRRESFNVKVIKINVLVRLRRIFTFSRDDEDLDMRVCSQQTRGRSLTPPNANCSIINNIGGCSLLKAVARHHFY